jgi:hypothetical protein
MLVAVNRLFFIWRFAMKIIAELDVIKGRQLNYISTQMQKEINMQ